MKLADWHRILGDDIVKLIAQTRLSPDEELASIAFADHDAEGDLLRAVVAGVRGIHDCRLRENRSGEFAGQADLVDWNDVRGVHFIDAPTWGNVGPTPGATRILVGRRPDFSFTPRDRTEADAAAAIERVIRDRGSFNLGLATDRLEVEPPTSR